MFAHTNPPPESIDDSTLVAIHSKTTTITRTSTISDLPDPFGSNDSKYKIKGFLSATDNLTPSALELANEKRNAYLSAYDFCSLKRKLQPDNFFEDNNLFADTKDSLFSFNFPLTDVSLPKDQPKKPYKLKSEFHLSPSIFGVTKFPDYSSVDSPPASPTISTKSNMDTTKFSHDSRSFSSSSPRNIFRYRKLDQKFSNSDTCILNRCFVPPSFPLAPQQPFEYVDAATVKNLISGGSSTKFDKLYILDCRFPYEFEGGHISGAINVPNIQALENLFFKNLPTEKNMLVVFHCEFSIKRAPSIARFFRNRDRELNSSRYPHLHYPTIYIIRGGYSSFFSKHQDFCNPPRYVTMDDTKHKTDCSVHFTNFERQFKRAKSATVSSSSLALYSPTSYLSKTSKSLSYKA